MKALQTTQDTELAEFLYLLAQTPRKWYIESWGGIRQIPQVGVFGLCPLAITYGSQSPFVYHHNVEAPSGAHLQIMMAADKLRSAEIGTYDPTLRQALLRATGLSEPELKEAA